MCARGVSKTKLDRAVYNTPAQPYLTHTSTLARAKVPGGAAFTPGHVPAQVRLLDGLLPYGHQQTLVLKYVIVKDIA